ncbi:MAG: hypothetical protein Q9187_002012 [Circinaria calcarea]
MRLSNPTTLHDTFNDHPRIESRLKIMSSKSFSSTEAIQAELVPRTTQTAKDRDAQLRRKADWRLCTIAVDFPEKAHLSFHFLNESETERAVARIQFDRGDVQPAPFSWSEVLRHFGDWKIYGFAAMFFLLNLVSTALAYFLPIILQGGMGFSSNQAILLSSPPYYYAVIPVLLSSRVGDKYRLRGPVITFNSLCLIAGIAMLGFSRQVTVRYIGVYLATGAYVSNWAALNSYQANNITGQWKRAVTAAAVTACNGLGGIAGSFIFKQNEAPRYITAIWVSIG